MNDRNNTDENPYAAPPIDVDLAMATSPFDPDLSEDEQIRHQYISHEAEVRSIAILYLIGSFLCALMAWVSLGFPASFETGNSSGLGFYDVIYPFIGVIIFGSFTFIFFGTGLGLRRLKPWSRICSVIISAIGLLAFPIGTLIAPYLLYLLLSGKAKVIFSAEYREIIGRTPHIKYNTPLTVKIIIGILLAVWLLGMLAMYLQTP